MIISITSGVRIEFGIVFDRDLERPGEGQGEGEGDIYGFSGDVGDESIERKN